MENSPEIDALLEVHEALNAQSGEVHTLSISETSRQMLTHILSDSAGETDETMRLAVLAALQQAERTTITIASSVSTILRREIQHLLEPLGIVTTRSLVHVPEMKTRMSDTQLCILVRTQLENGLPITLPEIELMQLIDLINRSVPQDNRTHVLWRIGPYFLNLERSARQSPEILFEVPLPADIAAEFLAELNQVNEIEDGTET